MQHAQMFSHQNLTFIDCKVASANKLANADGVAKHCKFCSLQRNLFSYIGNTYG